MQAVTSHFYTFCSLLRRIMNFFASTITTVSLSDVYYSKLSKIIKFFVANESKSKILLIGNY